MPRLIKPYFVKVYPPRKKVIVVGATSGLGYQLARHYLDQNCIVGVTGRRTEPMERLAGEYPGQVFWRRMDVQGDDAADILQELIDAMDGLDLLIYSAGVGTQNPRLVPEIEMEAVRTNVVGFVRIVVHAYNYFKAQNSGHIVDISSLAGVRPLRQSPAYSATKRCQMHYMSCLAQKANSENLFMVFTTIVPGFIRTQMLNYKYPFTVSEEKGARLIFNKIEKKRRYSTVPGRWRWIEVIWRLIPARVWEKIW